MATRRPLGVPQEERALTEGIVPPTEACQCPLQALICAGQCPEGLLPIIDPAWSPKQLPPVLQTMFSYYWIEVQLESAVSRGCHPAPEVVKSLALEDLALIHRDCMWQLKQTCFRLECYQPVPFTKLTRNTKKCSVAQCHQVLFYFFKIKPQCLA